MMRFIEKRYDANKEYFYKEAQKSTRIKSRFITGNKPEIKLNAIKALGMIMAAKNDEIVERDLQNNAETAFKHITCAMVEYRGFREIPIDRVLISVLVEESSDDSLHDTFAVFIYFCRMYKLEPVKDFVYKELVSRICNKELAYLQPFSEVLLEASSAEAEKTMIKLENQNLAGRLAEQEKLNAKKQEQLNEMQMRLIGRKRKYLSSRKK